MAIDLVGPGNIFGFYVVSSVIIPLVYVWFRRIRPGEGRASAPSITAWVFGAAGLAANAVGVLAETFALNTGLASLVVPVSSAYPVVTVLLAIALLHEKLSRRQTVALVFTLIGLMMIGATV